MSGVPYHSVYPDIYRTTYFWEASEIASARLATPSLEKMLMEGINRQYNPGENTSRWEKVDRGASKASAPAKPAGVRLSPGVLLTPKLVAVRVRGLSKKGWTAPFSGCQLIHPIRNQRRSVVAAAIFE